MGGTTALWRSGPCTNEVDLKQRSQPLQEKGRTTTRWEGTLRQGAHTSVGEAYAEATRRKLDNTGRANIALARKTRAASGASPKSQRGQPPGQAPATQALEYPGGEGGFSAT